MQRCQPKPWLRQYFVMSGFPAFATLYAYQLERTFELTISKKVYQRLTCVQKHVL